MVVFVVVLNRFSTAKISRNMQGGGWGGGMGRGWGGECVVEEDNWEEN